jgi:hypothetical protein
MKDCMFQYATNSKIIENTLLITKEEALDLWSKYKKDFIKRLENEEGPEMCIWVECTDDCTYGKSIMHIDQDSHVRHGDIYNFVKIG